MARIYQALKKEILKAKMKKAYLKAINFDNGASCGHNLLIQMSSEYYNRCKKFNELADKLSLLDSECPKFRFKLNT
jgi:hypothetical protein